MQHAGGVHGGDGAGRLRHQADGAAEVGAHALDVVTERAAGDELHRVVGEPVPVAGVVHGNDVGVLQRGERADLAGEPLLGDAVLRADGVDELQRDRAAGGELHGLVNHAHAAAGDEPADLVAGDGRELRLRPPLRGPLLRQLIGRFGVRAALGRVRSGGGRGRYRLRRRGPGGRVRCRCRQYPPDRTRALREGTGRKPRGRGRNVFGSSVVVFRLGHGRGSEVGDGLQHNRAPRVWKCAGAKNRASDSTPPARRTRTGAHASSGRCYHERTRSLLHAARNP